MIRRGVTLHQRSWLLGWLYAFLVLFFIQTGWSITNTVINTANIGVGSLYWAITNANASTGVTTINFQISGTAPFTITPVNSLPALTEPVIIDATTQPGYNGQPLVQLNGASTSGQTIGLRFETGSSFSAVRGLAINRFPIQAIELDCPSNTIQGNYIGTDVTGTLAKGNGGPGILVDSGWNLIGGTNAGNGNVVSGGNTSGIYLLNTASNMVQGNLVGVSATGTSSLGNQTDGIVISGSSNNLVGGPFPLARNIISGNSQSGVYLFGAGTTGNVIQGNWIGTDVTGSNYLRNAAGDGITIFSVGGNTIISNLISGNEYSGVTISGTGAVGNKLTGNYIGTDVTGSTNLGNLTCGVSIEGVGGNVIGGTNAGAGNVISGNVQYGILLTSGTTNNLILGNLIGLGAAGTNAVPNGMDGIAIDGGTNNLIGGVVAGARNVISGNSSNGIAIYLLTDTGNVMEGNYVGIDSTGTKAVPNKLSGIYVLASANFIGGTAAGAGNVVSGNTLEGIWVAGTSGNVTGNVIQGNFVGLNAAGTGALGNANGLGFSSAAANLVGGTVAGARNIISGNFNYGVFMMGSGTVSNTIQGNYIGTDPTGTLALGNYDAVYLSLATTNLIGGTQAGAGNLISGNTGDGVLFASGASWNIIQGNFLGTKFDGTNAMGNANHNIELDASSNTNFVGGTAAGAGNRIAYAKSIYAGVRVRASSANNLIRGNAIFGNGALGITLGSTTQNVNVDCEEGVPSGSANNGQNYPVITNVVGGAASTLIRGYLDSAPNKTYQMEFFGNPTNYPGGYGQGQVYLGAVALTLGSSCTSNFATLLPVPLPANWLVTATATDPVNNTSEFSADVQAVPPPVANITYSGIVEHLVTNVVTNLSGTHTNIFQYSTYTNTVIFYTNLGGPFVLQEAFSLTPPVTWVTLTNAFLLNNGNYSVTNILGKTNTFFRLTAP